MLVLKHRSGGVSRGNFCGKGKAYRSTFSCRVGRHILMAETHHKDKLLSARCIFGGPAAPWIGLLAITWIPSSLWGETISVLAGAYKFFSGRSFDASNNSGREVNVRRDLYDQQVRGTGALFFFSYTKGLANDKTYLYRGILNLQE